jgi:hypothetical protein
MEAAAITTFFKSRDTMQYSTQDAVAAARRIEPTLIPPSAHEFMLVPEHHTSAVSRLFARPAHHIIRETPRHLFEHVDFRLTSLPSEWIPAYLQHAVPMKRWEQFEMCYESWKHNPDATQIKDCQITHSGVAGLSLCLMSAPADSVLREYLLSWAMLEPIGAYFVGEALHLPEERQQIVESVKTDPRLLFWLSQSPGFGKSCLDICDGKLDLWAGLTLVRHSVAEQVLTAWLSELVVEAPTDPEAACAALVLQPNAPQEQKAAWVAVLKSASSVVQAFEALWWSRMSWSSGFDHLCAELLSQATADRSKFWYNWAVLDPVWGFEDFAKEPVAPLWALEFLQEMRLASRLRDDAPLRKQMVARLIQNHKDSMAVLVLGYLNRRVSP